MISASFLDSPFLRIFSVGLHVRAIRATCRAERLLSLSVKQSIAVGGLAAQYSIDGLLVEQEKEPQQKHVTGWTSGHENRSIFHWGNREERQAKLDLSHGRGRHAGISARYHFV
jgi:hypothetical protein